MFHFQYLDEDGDHVVLLSNNDLVAAVSHARLRGWKVRHISLSLIFYSTLSYLALGSITFVGNIWYLDHVSENGYNFGLIDYLCLFQTLISHFISISSSLFLAFQVFSKGEGVTISHVLCGIIYNAFSIVSIYIL